MDREEEAKLALAAQLDQFAAAMTQLAEFLVKYFYTLMQAGLSEERAFAMTLDLQRQLLAGGRGG